MGVTDFAMKLLALEANPFPAEKSHTCRFDKFKYHISRHLYDLELGELINMHKAYFRKSEFTTFNHVARTPSKLEWRIQPQSRQTSWRICVSLTSGHKRVSLSYRIRNFAHEVARGKLTAKSWSERRRGLSVLELNVRSRIPWFQQDYETLW